MAGHNGRNSRKYGILTMAVLLSLSLSGCFNSANQHKVDHKTTVKTEQAAGAEKTAASVDLSNKLAKAGDAVENKAAQAGSAIVSSLHSAGAAVANEAAYAKKAVTNEAQYAGKVIDRKTDQAGTAIGNTAEKAGDAVANNAEYTGEVLANNAEYARKVVVNEANYAGNALSNNAEYAGDVVENNVSYAGKVLDRKTDQAGHFIANNAEYVGNKLVNGAEDMGDAVENDAEYVGRKLAADAEEAGDAVEHDASYAGHVLASDAERDGRKVAAEFEDQDAAAGSAYAAAHNKNTGYTSHYAWQKFSGEDFAGGNVAVQNGARNGAAVQSGVQNGSSDSDHSQAKAVNAHDAAYMAIIIDDFGYNYNVVEDFNRLPIPLTYSVLPDEPYTTSTAEAGHNAGKDIIVHLPMESISNASPEPTTIRTNMPNEKIFQIATRNIASIPHAIGLNNHQGSKATADRRVVGVVTKAAINQGMHFFVDSHTTAKSVVPEVTKSMGLPHAVNNIFLDNNRNTEAVKGMLQKAAEIAKKSPNKEVIAIGHARPETAEALKEMIPTLQKQGVKFVYVRSLTH